MSNSQWHIPPSCEDIIADAPIGIFVTIPKGRFIFANEQLARILGYDSASQLTAEVTNIAEQLYDNSEDRNRFIQRLLYDGSVVNFEIAFTQRDGNTIWVSLSAKAAFDDNNNLTRIDGYLFDITERVLAKKALRRAKEEAQTANRAKTEFLATMSHEIRTPLHGMLGILELLTATQLNSTQREHIIIALRSGHSLLRILNDVLDLSKIEAGQLSLVSAPFDLLSLLADVEVLFTSMVDDKPIVLQVTPPNNPEQLMGDPGRLRQVLFNLVSNAVKFTREGRVTVQASLSSDGHQDAAWLRLAVTDTGVGIPPEFLDNMFTPFSQAKGNTHTVHQGTGLGLSIVKRLVDAMGGFVSVDSKPEEGTDIRVRVPVRFADARHAAGTPDDEFQAAPPDRPKNILLAEDERINRMLVEKMLASDNHRVVSVENGQQVLDALAKEAFDCVLLDVQMPVMDGLEAARRIRETMSSPPPLVALTAHAQLDSPETLSSHGLSGYLRKPFCKKELTDIIRKVCP